MCVWGGGGGGGSHLLLLVCTPVQESPSEKEFTRI